MRNCFVLGCDALCKKQNKMQRKMFLPPKHLLKTWADVLPNKKRPFKESDRVCELHFDECDIIDFWSSKINGQVHITPRDKPKLKVNAIPSRNLPTSDGAPLKPKVINPAEILLNKRNEKIQILSEKILFPAKRKRINEVEEEKVDEKESLEKVQKTIDYEVVETPIIEEISDMQKVIEEAEIEFELASAEHQEAFDNLYDEAFDVTLPSLLWGIHRCPSRKFIAFSEFSQKTMTNGKLLHINFSLRCTTFINNKLKSSKMLQVEKQVTDYVSEMLEELDKEPLTLS